MYKSKNESNVRMILLFLLTFVPLIVYGHSYSSGLGKYLWFGAEKQDDFFLFYKMCAVLVISGAMLCVIIVQFWKEELRVKMGKKEWIQFAAIGLFAGLTFVSTITSKYSKVGMWGGYDMFESVWVILGYAVITLYAFLYVSNNTHRKMVMSSLAIVSGIIGVIGTFQFLGFDFYQSSFMSTILSASVGKEIKMALESLHSYASLYNPNYLGVFCVLVIPVMISMVLESKKMKEKIAYSSVVLLLLISLVGSQSKTGIVVLALLLLLMLFFERRRIVENKVLLGLFVVIFVLMVGLVVWRGENFIQQMKNVFSIEKTEAIGWDSMKTTKDHVELCYGGVRFNVSLDNDTDDINEMLQITYEDGTPCDVSIYGDGTATLYITPKGEKMQLLQMKYGYVTETEKGFLFDNPLASYLFILQDGTYKLYRGEEKAGSIDTTKIEKTHFMDGYEKLFSGRGYIWKRTMPLLKNDILLGSGQGSFVYEFPNDDYAENTKYGCYGQIITKPHNIFLQMATQSGVLGMLLCVFAWLFYIIFSVRNNFRGDRGVNASIGIMIGIMGYVLMGFLNDSSITVAPIFWMLLGIGMRQNCEMYEHTKNEEKQAK